MTSSRRSFLDGVTSDPLFLCSCVLAIASLLALSFKAVSDSAWNDAEYEQTFSFLFFNDEFDINLYDIPLISTASYGLAWACIAIDLAVAALAICVILRARAKGPIYCTRVQQGCFYLVSYAAVVLSLATFGYVTHLHSRSGHLDTLASFYQIYDGLIQFDRETWACEFGAYSSATDHIHYVNRICVGETATRALLLVLGFATAVLAGVFESDRRIGQRIFRSWKTRAMEEYEIYNT